MRISYKGDYALKALLELALRYGTLRQAQGAIPRRARDGRTDAVSISEIASGGDMPENFLEQILLNLKRGGFVRSKRGVNGGFYLAKHPGEITVGSVIRFIEGPVEPIDCVQEDYKGCRDIKSCMLRGVWKDVSHAISTVIDTVTFEDLVIKYKEKELNIRPAYEYSI
jgi:Rrf2 family protein